MNLARVIERWAAHVPSKVAIRCATEDWTYAFLWERIEAATRGLAARGVAHGDRVAHLGYNTPHMLVLLFALARLGAILVPLNWRLTQAEHRTVLADCGANLLCHDPEFASHAESLAEQRLTLDGRWGEQSRDTVPAGGESDDLLIVYTSGTTGRPKGAVLTQSALLWNAFNAIHAQDIGQSDQVLTVLPMFHVGGLNNQTLPALVAGATVTLHRRFDAQAWLADAGRLRPTLSVLVPATMAAVIARPEWQSTDLSSLRMIATGSMIVPESLIRAFHARGVPVGQIYGCTETAPIATVLMKDDARAMVGSAGKPAAYCDAKVVLDDAGSEAGTGEVGEVWVRGPNVMRGYWNDPAATARSMHDGWFRTGDLARRDTNGFFWIVGRSKDVIISGGENIYPAELENVLADCADVAECAVIGIDDPKWGEAACACVVRAAGSAIDEQGVLALFVDRLARYKHPRRVIFLEQLPKSALGKVQKQQLARELAQTRQG